MNYIDQLYKEHSRSNSDLIAKHIAKDPLQLKKIIDIIYNEQKPLPQRASWILPLVNAKHPELLKPYIPLFVNTLLQFKSDGIKRHMLLVIKKHQIPNALRGKGVEIFFTLMLSKTEPVAVKAEAMEALSKLVHRYPDLKNEFKMAIEDQLPKTTVAFHSRAKRILEELK